MENSSNLFLQPKDYISKIKSRSSNLRVENLSIVYIYIHYTSSKEFDRFSKQKIRYSFVEEIFIEEKHFRRIFFNGEKQLLRDSNASLSPSTLWEFISSGDLNAIRYRFVRKSHLLANCCILSRRRRGTL